MSIDYDLKHIILLKMWQNNPKMKYTLSTYHKLWEALHALVSQNQYALIKGRLIGLNIIIC